MEELMLAGDGSFRSESQKIRTKKRKSPSHPLKELIKGEERESPRGTKNFEIREKDRR